MILAGDIGGTKTNLSVFELVGGKLKAAEHATFKSSEHGSLDEIVAKFVAAHHVRVERAGFGIAGPVKNGVCETTNLPWIVDSKKLARGLGVADVALINDLEANAWGIAALEPKDFRVLNEGARDARGTAAVVAAGTGLGEAVLFWDGRTHRPSPSEGGHTDFAPQSPVEVDLLRHLMAKFGHVSYERVLSGPGLANVYEFVRVTSRAPEPAWLTAAIRENGAPAAVSAAALAKKDPACVDALDLFARLYGAEAGNMALKVMAIGGVYLGGGIAPKIQDKLVDGAFMECFLAKGRMRALLETIPVRIILNDRTALLGAALRAAA
ncbi:MAG: glucokinase [Planctomycetes bacterium]|nr:glucokinase [Planctomycetota bacterium]MBI3843703.1 glucokinase [Planctomycetota bacterium]